MEAEVDFVILPYASAEGKSLLHLLIEELNGSSWTHFRAGVAFAKAGGNYEELFAAMSGFVARGGSIDLTFGADTFSNESRGSDYLAIEELVAHFDCEERVRISLYHEKGRTFHPKVYMFVNEAQKKALVFVGSSNWSSGGFCQNIEANVALKLDLTKKDHLDCYTKLKQCFDQYWSEV